MLVRVERLRQEARLHGPQVREVRQQVRVQPEGELVWHGTTMVVLATLRSCHDPPRPDDLYRLRVPIGVRLSPDGRSVVTSVKTVAPGFDGYRHALWLVPTDGGEARQLTIGAKNDWHARFSPDGRTIAFLSDRRTVVEEEPARAAIKPREDVGPGLPAAGGRRRGAPADRPAARRRPASSGRRTASGWSSSARRTRATFEADRRKRGLAKAAEPGTPPPSDYRFVDRLDYMLNGEGFTYDRDRPPVAGGRDHRRRDAA